MPLLPPGRSTSMDRYILNRHEGQLLRTCINQIARKVNFYGQVYTKGGSKKNRLQEMGYIAKIQKDL